MSGYIYLWRDIQNHEFYYSEKFTDMQAWIDLILRASFTDTFFKIRGNMVALKRGQLACSEDFLAEKWKWSRGKVRRYLKTLESRQQIVQQKSRLITIISIINYNKFQSDDTTDDTTDSTTDSTSDGTHDNKLNKLNKLNKEKDKTIVLSKKKKFLIPTIDEVREYCIERKNDIDPEKFIAFYESNGWMVGQNPMKSWKGAIITWECRNGSTKPLCVDNEKKMAEKAKIRAFEERIRKEEELKINEFENERKRQLELLNVEG